MSESPLLIVGLGNPGAEYEHTRHNAGFMAIEYFANEVLKLSSSEWREKFNGYFCSTQWSNQKILLLKPDTYMNESGRAVSAACKFFKISPEQVCVLHDELDIPLGSAKCKLGGGDGGHNGLKSISQSLGTKNYNRIRIGISRPKFAEKADNKRDLVHSWVLGRFSRDESRELQGVLTAVGSALTTLISEGYKEAQMALHRKNK